MSTSIPYMMTANLLTPLDYTDYTSKSLDHLGIVATVCKEIGLADEIDRIVGVDPRQKVTCGEAVVAMVLNALGFVDRPLYLFPEFMATKPVEILIREGLKAENFNDDVLGRTLDKLYRAGPEGIFMQIAANAYGEYAGRFLHNDTTSMSLQGEYEHEEQRGRRTEGCTGERKAVEVSRDKRAMETKRKRENGGRGRPRKDDLEKVGETLPDTAVSSRCLRVLQSFTEDQRWWRS